MIRRLTSVSELIVVPLLILVLWEISASLDWLPRMFLPAPSEIWSSLRDMMASGDLLTAVGQTWRRLLLGWFTASVLGIALGLLIGSSAITMKLLGPILEFFRPLPASAVIPLFVLALGLTDAMIVVVIAFGSLWPVLLSTTAGVQAVDRRLREVARGLELTGLQVFRYIILPAALPHIFDGLRLGVTLALVLCVVAEMITMGGGLGGEILLASRNFRSADLFAGVVLIGLSGLLLNSVIGSVQHRFAGWRS